MERPGLTALPVEVLHHISQYLSVQDVMSCSLTCHYLRAALNDNSVWKRYLPEEDISGLETREQQVSPRLEMDEGLSPLCEKRQQYARKTHLMNNWREGNYVQYTNRSKSGLYVGMLTESSQTDATCTCMYKDKYIFLQRSGCGEEGDKIEIWDITKVPILHTVFNLEDLRDHSAYRYHVAGSHLIILERSRVSVYQIKLPDKDLPLCYSFLITDNNVTFNDIVHRESHGDDRHLVKHYAVNNYLMSSQYESNRLHVWDINNASKIGSFEPPVHAYVIELQSFFGNICMFKLDNFRSNNYLVTLNLDNKQFSNNKLICDRYVRSVIMCKGHFILLIRPAPTHSELGDIILRLHDCNTLLKISQRRLTNATIQYELLSSQCFVDGTFIITCDDRFHLVNALTLEIVNTVYHYNIRQRDILYYFNVYQNKVIAAAVTKTKNKEKRRKSSKSTIQLWHVSRKDVPQLVIDVNVDLYLDLESLYGPGRNLFIDSLCTKLILIKDSFISVIHLW